MTLTTVVNLPILCTDNVISLLNVMICYKLNYLTFNKVVNPVRSLTVFL